MMSCACCPTQHVTSIKHLLEAVLVQGRPPVGPLIGRLLHLQGIQRVRQLLLQLLELGLQNDVQTMSTGKASSTMHGTVVRDI